MTTGCLLMANTLFAYTRQDTLRGSNGNGRNWWDVQQYSLRFDIDTLGRSIKGENTILFTIVGKIHDSIQIDLQEPMLLDSVMLNGKPFLNFVREGNVYWLKDSFSKYTLQSVSALRLFYHGKPREAVKPPWDGGFIWSKDSSGKPWISVACQGLGASSWWPCKDYQGDEPDSGMVIYMPRYLGKLDFVSNGHLKMVADTLIDPNTGVITVRVTDQWWKIENPINTYDATFYLGDYVHWTDSLHGIDGPLALDFYALRYNKEKAREQFKQVKPMLRCFEYWFGPYPFYKDGYKIVEAPFLGMEHQSAIAYGNNYVQGYKGRDRSSTGVGLLFDFIIVHESGHEWFGNSITATDIADNWIHEGFTTYAETLFAECQLGKEKAFEYCRGEWKNIRNDRPIIGSYGVNDEGSADKYDKGSALIHTIRLVLNDDVKFRSLLHEINTRFYHKQIGTQDVVSLVNQYTGHDFTPIFDQYLRTVDIPVLEWYVTHKRLHYRFTHIVPGFSLPLTVFVDGITKQIQANATWQTMKLKNNKKSILFPEELLVKNEHLASEDIISLSY